MKVSSPKNQRVVTRIESIESLWFPMVQFLLLKRNDMDIVTYYNGRAMASSFFLTNFLPEVDPQKIGSAWGLEVVAPAGLLQ